MKWHRRNNPKFKRPPRDPDCYEIPTLPQRLVFEILHPEGKCPRNRTELSEFDFTDWVLEFPLYSKAMREAGAVNHYKVDIANLPEHIAIEVDGKSHNQPNAMRNDGIKEAALQKTGWRLLRLKNKDILKWYSAGTLRLHITEALAGIGYQLVKPQ